MSRIHLSADRFDFPPCPLVLSRAGNGKLWHRYDAVQCGWWVDYLAYVPQDDTTNE